jgi:hypothetical protein
MTLAITNRLLPQDAEMRRVVNKIYDLLAEIVLAVNARPAITQVERQQIARDTAGLLGAFAQPLIGAPSDPLLDSVRTGDAVTSVDISASGNLSASGGPVTTTGTLNVVLTDTPAFDTVEITGMKWLGKTVTRFPPSLTEYPNSNDAGFHEDEDAQKIYLAFNYEGTILSVELV